MKLKFSFAMIFAGMLFLIGSSQAYASLYNYEFYSITNTINENVAIGEAQLSVDVTDEGVNLGQVLFTFYNTGPDACSIAEVYFDDGSLLGIAELIDKDYTGGDDGVDFEFGANPSNLPSGNNATPPFAASVGFYSSQAVPPSPDWGVNPSESLGILFYLQSGQTYDDVIDDLSSGALRIGLHVTGFALGESESFINTVPIPSTVWIFGAGIIGLFGIRRKLARH